MNVGKVMSKNVKTCRPDDTLNTAAGIMWEYDCGCVPVVGDGAVVGMLTDHDICMAAYTQGGPLNGLQVSSAMSRHVYSCRPEDSLTVAEEMLQRHQIRRAPVIDEDGHLVGILSLNDIAREAAHERSWRKRPEVSADEVAKTLAMICEHRPQSGTAAAA